MSGPQVTLEVLLNTTEISVYRKMKCLFEPKHQSCLELRDAELISHQKKPSNSNISLEERFYDPVCAGGYSGFY